LLAAAPRDPVPALASVYVCGERERVRVCVCARAREFMCKFMHTYVAFIKILFVHTYISFINIL
jgi:hypothetical protein